MENYYSLLGGIVGNMISLETILRVYLLKKEKKEANFIQLDNLIVGDEIELSPFTDYSQLSKLIESYNNYQNSNDIIDRNKIIRIRDLLAHGRTLSKTEDLSSLIAIKFSPEIPNKKGFVRVTDKEILNEKWLKSANDLVFAALMKVKAMEDII